MSSITIPITSELETYISSRVADKTFNNTGHFVTNAIKFFREEIEVGDILLAAERSKKGVRLSGDLDELSSQSF